MTFLSFALRRTLRARSFLLLLLMCMVGVFFSALDGAGGSTPPGGICSLSGGECAARITDTLVEQGFRLCSGPEQMEELVRSGELNCGVILPADLDALIQKGLPDGAVRFLTAPTSYAPQQQRNLAAAALFRECAPYLTAEALAHTDVSREQVLERYWAMFEQGALFTFDLLEADGAPLPSHRQDEALTMGALSVLLMIAMLTGITGAARGDFGALCRRIGSGRAMKTVFLPGAAVRILLAALATALSLLLASGAGREDCLTLLPAALIHILLLSSAGMLLGAALPQQSHRVIILSLLLIAAVALCPIFTDLTLFSPLLAVLRWLIPAYWLWPIREQPLLWLAAALAALPLSAGLLLLRLNRSTERSFS